jgi:DNA-binding HxlR family transcriptional regulator
VVTDQQGLTRLNPLLSAREQSKQATRALRLEALMNNEFVQRRAPAEEPVVKGMVQALVDAELRMALPSMADWLEHMKDWTTDPDAGWRWA